MGRFFPRKLTGAQARLFAAGCLEYSHEVEEELLDFFSSSFAHPDEHPLFAWLSGPQRIHLVAQVARGLLCENEPLPPNTLEHYAAFLGVFALLNIKLEVEADQTFDMMDDADMIAFCKQGEEEQQPPRPMDDDEKEKRNNDMHLIGRKAEKYKKKLEGSLQLDDAFAPPEPSGNEHYIALYQDFSAFISPIFSGGPCTKADRRPPRPLTREERNGLTFAWRMLADAAFQQDTPENNPMFFGLWPTLSDVNFCWKCPNRSKWKIALDVLSNRVGAELTERENKMLCGSIGDLDYADKTQHPRIRAIKRAVTELRQSYETDWKPEDTSLEQRVIYAICSTESAFHLEQQAFVLNFNKLCRKQQLLVSGMELGERRAWHTALMREFGIDSGEDYILYKDWYLPGHYQQRLDIYRSFGQREMLQQDLAKGLDKSFMKGYAWKHPRTFQADKQLYFRSKCSNPSHKLSMENLGNELKECSRCKVVQYCSKECQRQHWPKHKTDCKKLSEDKKNAAEMKKIIQNF